VVNFWRSNLKTIQRVLRELAVRLADTVICSALRSAMRIAAQRDGENGKKVFGRPARGIHRRIGCGLLCLAVDGHVKGR